MRWLIWASPSGEKEKGRIQPGHHKSELTWRPSSVRRCDFLLFWTERYYWTELLFLFFFFAATSGNNQWLVVCVEGCRMLLCYYYSVCNARCHGIYIDTASYSTFILYSVYIYVYPVYSSLLCLHPNHPKKLAAVLPSDWLIGCIIR